jgi:hypothetical protein
MVARGFVFTRVEIDGQAGKYQRTQTGYGCPGVIVLGQEIPKSACRTYPRRKPRNLNHPIGYDLAHIVDAQRCIGLPCILPLKPPLYVSIRFGCKHEFGGIFCEVVPGDDRVWLDLE